MSRFLLAICLFFPLGALRAEPVPLGEIMSAEMREELVKAEAPLVAARPSLADCEERCITPSEAVALAFAAGEGQSRAGRFLLEVRGGGRSVGGALDNLFFVNSMQGYARFGTLTIAIEDEALNDLMRRPRGCGGGLTNRGIVVEGCASDVRVDLNMFSLMRWLTNKRLVVDGEVQLQWIDSSAGTLRRKGGERGYYQVWVHVTDADQVTIVFDS
ncbi:MAG: hypothetical protein AAF687_07685 [Pseudomonadota bacterium]